MTGVLFFVGLNDVNQSENFDRCCLSVNRLWGRLKPVPCNEVLVDSGAFREIDKWGEYRTSVAEHAHELFRLKNEGVVPHIAAAVAQDYMCEPRALGMTRMSVVEHQRLTIERYDALMRHSLPFHIMPVLQGYTPREYYRHVRDYGARFAPGHWVGVGSVCKRNAAPGEIIDVLSAILDARPDLNLHGFGIKKTALMHSGVRQYLASADSMSWSYSARKQGRDQHDWREARAFCQSIEETRHRPALAWQMPLPFHREDAA